MKLFLIPIVLSSPVKIINGKSASDGQFPHQVTLKKSNGSHYCGGSIVSTLKVMTSASCHQTSSAGLQAGAGSVRINSQRQTRPISGQLRHPEFNAQLIDFDFMIVSVASPWKVDRYAAPIKLPLIEEDELPMHTSVTTSGYGYTELIGGFPAVLASTLKYLEMEYIERTMCRSLYPRNHIGYYQVCALADNATPCSGDTGGPLTVRQGGEMRLLGNMSWAQSKCKTGSYPAVFSNNADPDIHTWITRHL